MAVEETRQVPEDSGGCGRTGWKRGTGVLVVSVVVEVRREGRKGHGGGEGSGT